MRVTIIREATDVSEARRQAVAAAGAAGYAETASGRVAIVATELATNVLRHGGGGELLAGGEGDVLELIALDQGPGMASVEACLEDGYSTGGTRGEGLGAVVRQADFVDIYSRPGLGAAVLARFGGGSGPRRWAGLEAAYPGELVCGDAWAVCEGEDGSLSAMVADGLGHGLLAAEAAAAAISVFASRPDAAPARHLEAAHGALRASRGAAVAVARLDTAGVVFAGVGNIAGVVVSAAGARKMISHNGTVGHVAKRFQAFDYPAVPPSLVVMHSDGLGSNWTLDRYPGLAGADPAVIAGVLYRDFSRRRDDVCVVVLKAGG